MSNIAIFLIGVFVFLNVLKPLAAHFCYKEYTEEACRKSREKERRHLH